MEPQEKLYYSLLSAGVVAGSSTLGVLGGSYLVERLNLSGESEYIRTFFEIIGQGEGLLLGLGVGAMLSSLLLPENKK